MKSTSKNSPFSTLIPIFYIFSLFCSHFAVASSNNIVNRSCSQAAETDPNFTYEFCVDALRESPKSQNATLEELVVISMLLARSNSTRISSKIYKLLNNTSLQKYTKDRLEVCSEVYWGAKSDLSTAEKAFGHRDYYTANIRISAAMDAAGTCEDGFKEKEGEVSPLRKENSFFFRLTAVSLALLSLYHS